MSTLAANVVSFIRKAGIVQLSAVMQFLVDMVTSLAPVSNVPAHSNCTDASGQTTLVSLCRNMVPENFVRSLLDKIASEMVRLLTSFYMLLCYTDFVSP